MRFLFLKFVFNSALLNLWRSPSRTVISLLAICVAVAAIVSFQSFVGGVTKSFRQNVITSDFGHFQIYKKGYRDNMTDKPFAYQIEETSQLRADLQAAVGPLQMFSTRQPFFALLSHDNRSLGAMGIGIVAPEEKAFLTSHVITDGKHLGDTPARDSVMVGDQLAKQIGVGIGDFVTALVTTARGSMNAVDLVVSGIFKTGVTEIDRLRFYIHHATASELVRVTGASSIMIGMALENELAVKDKLEAVVAKSYPDLEIVHWRVLATFFEDSLGWIKTQAVFFRFIILLVATLAIASVFTMTLMERVGEFGTLKALGVQNQEIALIVFIEGALLAFLGTLGGLLLGVGLLKTVFATGITMPPAPNMSKEFFVPMDIPWDSLLMIMILCTGVVSIATIFPMRKIAKINIVTALGRNV